MRWRVDWRRLPLGALFACALLVGVELGTRAFFKPPYVSLATYTNYYPLAPLYGFEGSRACFRVGEQMSCAKTQDMNIIPQTFPARKPAGELRILVVGASISWEGSNYRQGSSEGNYPNRTLAILQAAHPDQALRLINLSVPGIGTSRIAVRFREALEYEPDLIVVHLHDTSEIREDKRRAYVKMLHAGLAGKLLYLQSVVVSKAWWGEVFQAPEPPRRGQETEESPEEDDVTRKERWTAGIKHNVQTMLEFAKARSIPVVLVGPSRLNRQSGVRDRPLNQYFRTQANGSTSYLDVVQVFQADFAEHHKPLFKDTVHYSAQGTRVVAAALAPLIESALPALSHPR